MPVLLYLLIFLEHVGEYLCVKQIDMHCFLHAFFGISDLHLSCTDVLLPKFKHFNFSLDWELVWP